MVQVAELQRQSVYVRIVADHEAGEVRYQVEVGGDTSETVPSNLECRELGKQG